MATLRYADHDYDVEDGQVQEIMDAIVTALGEGRAYWLQLSTGDDIDSVLITAGAPVTISRPQPKDNTMYEAPDRDGQKVVIDSAYVDAHLGELVQDPDLSRYIL